MSKMSTTPVYACRVCGKSVVVSNLHVFKDDPENKLLMSMMKSLQEIALCPYHQEMRNWYAQQGRIAEFEANYFNPHSVLYSVNDEKGVGWYASIHKS